MSSLKAIGGRCGDELRRTGIMISLTASMIVLNTCAVQPEPKIDKCEIFPVWQPSTDYVLDSCGCVWRLALDLDDVMLEQRALQLTGHYVGPIDGKTGRATLSSRQAFQAEFGSGRRYREALAETVLETINASSVAICS